MHQAPAQLPYIVGFHTCWERLNTMLTRSDYEFSFLAAIQFLVR